MKRLLSFVPLFLCYRCQCQHRPQRMKSAKTRLWQPVSIMPIRLRPVELTPAPEGYEPFYISMFARHGSRYLTKQKKYDKPLAVLRDAEKATYPYCRWETGTQDSGKSGAGSRRTLWRLTPKGAEQHRQLVRRMFARYPQVFTDGVHVDARSTYKTPCFPFDDRAGVWS